MSTRMVFVLLFVTTLVIVAANDLTNCCHEGKRHFEQTSTCSKISLKKQKQKKEMLCIRTASICCLSAMLSQSCKLGTQMAKNNDFCPTNINQIGGGLRKECCECCALAKELAWQTNDCSPPDDFSAMCLSAFRDCCNFEQQSTISSSFTTENHVDSVGLHRVADRCATAHCEHLCSDLGGQNVECSCRLGYELSSDGYSCLDIDECLLLADDCLESQRCLNTPGSFKCIRTLSCGTGYALDSDTEQCTDVDECNLRSHDCGPLYQCRNTQGSYRCDVKKCADGELMNPRTGECASINCPIGHKPVNGRCEDVNECESFGRCRQYEECINTPGSYRCQEQGNLCSRGYQLDRGTGFCIDIDECATGSHFCGDKQCINLSGSYKCRCSAGFEFNETSMRCEDVDECLKFTGHVCSLHATCENTLGSFKCHCKEGFKIAKDGRNCDDIDECISGIAQCAQRCVNIPGSYQCICERGYRLGTNGITCEDIDECTLWAGSGDDLCMGSCINTPGSYQCLCPPGYEIQNDSRTCKDIDECVQGLCRESEQICVNTLGSFKCHNIHCPPNYVHDKNYKNTVDDGFSCLKKCHPMDAVCLGNHTREILYQFHSLPSVKNAQQPIEISRVRAQMDKPFSVEYRIDRLNQNKFIVYQEKNIGIVKMILSTIRGPSTELVRLHINIYSRSHVLLAHNVALITIYISPNDF